MYLIKIIISGLKKLIEYVQNNQRVFRRNRTVVLVVAIKYIDLGTGIQLNHTSNQY